MASRGSLTVLEPVPLNRLHDAAHIPLKKRKRCASLDEWEAQNIVIRAHAASLSDDPFVLEPIAVLPRSRLPFDWLDVPSALSQIQSGSLFVANIPALEADAQPEPVVLAVRLLSDGGLYIIEKVNTGIYALSKLARHVEEGDIYVAVKAASRILTAGPVGRSISSTNGGSACDSDWWRIAQVEDPAPGLGTPIPAKRARVEVVFGVPSDHVDGDNTRMKGISPIDSAGRSPSCDDRMVSVAPASQGLVEPAVTTPGASNEQDINWTEQSPQELLDGLSEQYLQALYISKTSVAYFAKGPLPRCRAAFQSSGPGSNKSSELIDFYREAILTAKKMDLKYRETLPTTIQDVMLSTSDDDEMTGPKKRKSKRKKAVGRNGLYPEEPNFIKRWWKNRSLADSGALVETSREAEVKKYVSDLRLRETQLQILLILETMALETAAADEGGKTLSNEGGNSPEQALQKQKPKGKKPQDLNVMIELHLDRLCIWHAVSFGDSAVSDITKSLGSDPPSGKVAGNDAMRDFCTEVIIPFYASRLPDRCKSITRKLGVSVGNISPFPKSSSAKKIPRGEPGAAVERKLPQKHPRRALQRVLTDEQTTSQGRAKPTLSRSNTAPSQSGTRRNSINPLLPVLSTSVRGGIQKAKRVENREVDLIAVARQHESKLKRVQMLADQKRELDAAILTLRKPNRELVAQDIAKDADKRLTSSGSSRKPKNPVRNPFGQGVQVMATPKGSRKKDVVGLPPLSRSLARSPSKPRKASALFSSPFSGEPQVIPGSAIRSGSFSGASLSTNVGAVHETPSRRPPQPLGSLNDTTALSVAGSPSFPGTGNLFRVPRRPAPRAKETDPTTPVAARHVDVTDADVDVDVDMHLDSTRTRLLPPPPPPPLFTLPSINQTTARSSTVLETPPKAGPIPFLQSGRRPSGSGVGKTSSVVPVSPEKSIYAHLGWDDDDDLTL